MLRVAVLVVIGVVGCTKAGSDDTASDTEVPPLEGPLSGEITLDDLTLPGGVTVDVTDDLVLTVTGDCDIAGVLAADPAIGQSITVSCGGDVSVTGAVTAGAGDTGAGGTVVLRSTAGDLGIGATATITAGDGIDGGVVVDPATDGAGSPGGDVVLEAAGTLTIDAGAVVVLGNGGNGTDVVLAEPGAGDLILGA